MFPVRARPLESEFCGGRNTGVPPPLWPRSDKKESLLLLLVFIRRRHLCCSRGPLLLMGAAISTERKEEGQPRRTAGHWRGTRLWCKYGNEGDGAFLG